MEVYLYLVGNICTIYGTLEEADFHETYVKHIVDLLVAEGLLSGHGLLYASQEIVDQLLNVCFDIAKIVCGF